MVGRGQRTEGLAYSGRQGTNGSAPAGRQRTDAATPSSYLQ
jgi:hypothetical protein